MMDFGEILVRKLPKKLFLRCALALALMMSFKFFQFFPGMSYVHEAWMMLCFLIVLLIYPFWKIRSGLQFSWFEIYLLILMFADVLLATWRAHDVFGQPLMFGILAQRGVMLTAIWLVLMLAMRSRAVQLEDIEAVMVSLAWGTFSLYVVMGLFLNPSNFANVNGFVTQAMPGTAPTFIVQNFFILFGVFYYALLGMRTNQAKYYLAAAILFPITLGGSGRGLLVCTAGTLLYFLYRLRGMRKATIAAVKFGCVTAALAVIFSAIYPTQFSQRVAGFSDAFTVLFTGTTTQDVSSNARIFETLTALPYIQQHPILGNGVISHQWQGGNEGALGAYFFADDIGVIGVVFSYGALGLLLYLVQYRFSWRAAKSLPGSFHSPLLDATKAFIVYSAIYSLPTGMFVWSASVTLFFVALLRGIATQTIALNIPEIWSEEACSRQRPA